MTEFQSFILCEHFSTMIRIGWKEWIKFKTQKPGDECNMEWATQKLNVIHLSSRLGQNASAVSYMYPLFGNNIETEKNKMHCKYLNFEFSIRIGHLFGFSSSNFVQMKIQRSAEWRKMPKTNNTYYYNGHLIKQMDVKGYLFTHEFHLNIVGFRNLCTR